jgi:hypothetical protein
MLQYLNEDCFNVIIGYLDKVSKGMLKLTNKQTKNIIKNVNFNTWHDHTFNDVIKNGYLEILKWAKKNDFNLPMNICYTAIFYNQLDVLKWAKKSEYYLDDSFGGAARQAAKLGHLEIIKWLHEEKLINDHDICCFAARKGPQHSQSFGCECGLRSTSAERLK